MTDVWKSQAKKFCSVCKCWFADNRASIDFHEKGERHKAAIARSLRENAKKQERDARDQASLNSTLAMMESGALAAMKKDGSQATPSSFFDPRNFKDVRSMAWELGKRQGPSQTTFEPESTAPKAENLGAYDARFEGKVWVEADDEEGRKYYFHMNTGETTWTKPAIFFTEDQYDNILAGRDPDAVNDTGPAKKKRKRKARHFLEKQPEIDLNSLNLPKLEPFKKNPEFLVPQILVPSTNSELPKVQHFKPGEKSSVQVKNEEEDEEPHKEPVSHTIPSTVEETSKDSHASVEADAGADAKTKIIHVDGAVLKIEPKAPGAHLLDEMKKNKYAAPPMGQWTRVIRDESEICTESPLTARYREAEQKEEAEREAREKFEERFEPKTTFAEKKTETITKKVKGPIEFKKKSGPRNIRKREE